MILTTTPTFEGHTITKYLGLVTGETIIGANFIRDFLANITDVLGGRSGAYEKVLGKAKKIALQEMSDEAQKLGANAVVSIDLDYEAIGESGSMLMVSASGTAVIVE